MYNVIYDVLYDSGFARVAGHDDVSKTVINVYNILITVIFFFFF